MTLEEEIRQATIGSQFRGKVNTYQPEWAKRVADHLKGQGFSIRVTDRGLTQGNRIYPITVSWWPKR
jgi:hypothetical protein